MSGRLLMRSSMLRASRNLTSTKLPQITRARPAPAISALAQKPFARPITASFSTSIQRCESEGQVNAELSAKLESELSMEKEMRDTSSLPDHLQEYLDNSPYKLEDTAGKEEVVLTRTFGDENIRVSFTIDDLNNVDEDPDQLTDSALEDEFEAEQDGKANVNQGGTGANMRTAPEDRIAPSDREGLEGEEQDMEGQQDPSFPAHVSITIQRPGRGAMEIQTVAQDGIMIVDNVHFFKDAKYLEPKNHEDDRVSGSLYTGPPFSNLDEDLQELFERYLDERGINTTMALFIPEYIDFKEQNEYLNWLSNVKEFVD